MDIRWQDEEKLLSNWIYKPEKEKWERNNNVTLGFLHWDVYLIEYPKSYDEKKFVVEIQGILQKQG